MQDLHRRVQGLHLLGGDAVDVPSGWISGHVEARWAGDGRGRGLFAIQDIPPGTILCVFGGSVLPWKMLRKLSPDSRRMALQVEDDLFLVSTQEGPSDWVNHSCDPNSGMAGQITLVSMRKIRVFEEITFDYAMTDSLGYDEFECACGAHDCRGVIHADDWRSPDLQRRYAGYFSPYLERRFRRVRA